MKMDEHRSISMCEPGRRLATALPRSFYSPIIGSASTHTRPVSAALTAPVRGEARARHGIGVLAERGGCGTAATDIGDWRRRARVLSLLF